MFTDLGYLILISFGSMKLTEFYKEVTRRLGLHQVAWWKSMVNLVLCGLLALLVVNRSIDVKLLIALGASGLAALIHALDTVLRSHRDDMITTVMDKSRTRRR